jgi:hypothetical protein
MPVDPAESKQPREFVAGVVQVKFELWGENGEAINPSAQTSGRGSMR